MSVDAPGGKGLMICTVFVGYSAAWSAETLTSIASGASAINKQKTMRTFFISVPFKLTSVGSLTRAQHTVNDTIDPVPIVTSGSPRLSMAK
jgi:hypothetical protein